MVAWGYLSRSNRVANAIAGAVFLPSGSPIKLVSGSEDKVFFIAGSRSIGVTT